ncbi:MAG: hypothetical protein ACI4TR_00635, partial [Bacteroidaceae bacterium]
MKRKIFCCLAVLLLSVSIGAQSWLPSASCDKQRVRLLGCQYAGARLQKTVEVDRDNPDWSVKQRENSRFGGTDYVFTAKRSMKEVGVAVALDCPQWSSDNYVMIPSVVYGGNRQRIVNREYATGLDATDFYRSNLALTSNPIPQLSPEFGSKSMIEVNVSNCATPAIVFFERARKCATILFTDQGIRWQGEVKDHALIVEESPDRSMATMVISAPGVRSRKPEFIGFSDSPDRGVSVKEGDTIVIRVDIVG